MVKTTYFIGSGEFLVDDGARLKVRLSSVDRPMPEFVRINTLSTPANWRTVIGPEPATDRESRPAAPVESDIADDGECHFLRRRGTDIEARRRMNPAQILVSETLFSEVVED